MLLLLDFLCIDLENSEEVLLLVGVTSSNTTLGVEVEL